MKKRYTFILLAICIMVNGVYAQSFSTKVSSQTIGKKDVLQVEYVAENLELQDLVLPVFRGWSILSGPNFSSNRLQTGNIVKQQVVYTITLQPQATGKLTIPGAKATIDDKTRLSNTVTIVVKDDDHVAGSQPAAPPSPQSSLLDQLTMGDEDINDDQVLKKGESARDKVNDNLFVKLDVSKKTAFVGEPILATYKLCTRIRSQSRVVKQPAFSGCTVVEMTADDPLPQKEKIGNKWFNVYIIRQVQLIPLQAGIIHLPQASVENTVTFYREGQVNYRDLFYNNPAIKPEELTVTYESAPLQVEVKPLPLPAPANFGGAVGEFNIHINNSTTGGATNNSNQLLVSVEGSGNLQPARPPVIDWPAGMEGFDPAEKDEIDKTVFPAHVSKVFSYAYVAAKTGDYQIPPVSFTYFSTAQNKYVTVTTRPVKFHVEKSSRSIFHPKANTDTKDFYDRLYILLGAGLLAIIVGLIFFNRKSKKPATVVQPVETVQQEAAPPIDTDQYVYDIRQLEPTVDGPLFYRKLHKGITGWLLGKYNITPQQTEAYASSYPDLAGGLHKLSHVLNNCSLCMYTPTYNVEDAIQDRLTTLEAIGNLEKIS